MQSVNDNFTFKLCNVYLINNPRTILPEKHEVGNANDDASCNAVHMT